MSLVGDTTGRGAKLNMSFKGFTNTIAVNLTLKFGYFKSN